MTALAPLAERLQSREDLELIEAPDHLELVRGEARLLIVLPAFLERPEEDRDALRGEPAAPLVLIGASAWPVSQLATWGVTDRFESIEALPEDTIDLRLMTTAVPAQQLLSSVLDVASSLTAERDPDRLLGRILRGMREICGADAGSLYVVVERDGERVLRFRCAQNDTLGLDAAFDRDLPLDRSSIAGYVVSEGMPLNIEDAYQLPPAPFVFNRSFDQDSGYRTHSMLTVPLRDPAGTTLGAVQLINRRRGDGVSAFSAHDEALATGLAGAAAIALVNTRLNAEIERVFEGFVRAAVYAVDARDPTTAGHSLRVARLSTALGREALTAGFEDTGGLAKPDGLRRLEFAALLHDFGKIGVAEDVLLKAKRLYPHEMDTLQDRFETIAMCNEIEFLRRALEGERPRPEVEAAIKGFNDELYGILAQLVRANEPEPLTGETRDFIKRLSERTWVHRQGHVLPYLTPREQECFNIPYGSLTKGEREAIESHVVHSERFLEQIPWGKTFHDVPCIAGRHHEKLDGSGYPKGLPAEEIPLESRIITVVDIYDALTAADRPYKSALPHVVAVDILWSESDRGRLDERLVEVFVEQHVHRVLTEDSP